MSENELVQSARAGDEDAFAELVSRHADQVYGALRRFGLDSDEADETAQAVFVRAWRGLARFEGRAQLSTWLYRIAFNEAQRALRRRRSAAARASGSAPDGAPDPVAAVAEDELRGPDARALDREFGAELERALGELRPEWRSAVVLRDLEGLSTAEAAEVTGLGEAAFKSRLHRGRMALRELLGPYLGSIVS